MGYRLEVSEVKPRHTICGGKLYGYSAGQSEGDGIEKLKSYQWLKEYGAINGNEFWCYGCSIDVVLSAENFREFFDLYCKDFKRINGHELTLSPVAIKSYENEEDKLIQWY